MKYLSHWSALCEMNIPFLNSCFEPQILKNTDRKHYVVFSRGHRYQRKGEKVHLCSQELPMGALRTRNGQRIVSPEFAFLQVAFDLAPHRLILLGLLMCATPYGRRHRPATTVEKLKAFVVSMERHRGRRRALRALKYVKNYSRSPMEILTYLLLCLPNHVGGAGFTGATFDYRIELSPKDRAYLSKRCLYADLAYPEHKVILEYNGEDHKKATQKTKDAKRQRVLESMGFQVINIVVDDLYEEDRLYNLIERLEEALQKRVRMETRTYADGFARILNMMPRRHPVIPAEEEEPNGFLTRALERFESFFGWMGVRTGIQRSG